MSDTSRKNKKAKFLEAMATHGNVTLSCQSAGVPRRTVYEWRDADTEFAQAWDEALEGSNDLIRYTVFDRAVHGWQEPLVSVGKLVRDDMGQPMQIQKYDSSLLQFLARSRMPEFREKSSIEHSGSIDVAGAKELLIQKLQQLKENGDE